MTTIDINVKGLAELQKFLDQLPAKMQANIMRGALRAGMKTIKLEVERTAPRKTGGLAMSFKLRLSARAGQVKGILRASGFDGYKAMWIEFGTRPHLISVPDEEKKINYRLSAKRGYKVLESMTTVNRRVLQIGNNFVGPTVSHPGVSPAPFMRPALDSQAQAAVVAAAEYIKKRLAKKHGLDTADIDIEVDV